MLLSSFPPSSVQCSLTPSLVDDMQAPRGQGGRADPIAGCLAQAFGIQNGGTGGVRRYCLAEVGWAVVWAMADEWELARQRGGRRPSSVRQDGVPRHGPGPWGGEDVRGQKHGIKPGEARGLPQAPSRI